MDKEYIKAVLDVIEYVETAGYNNFDSDTCKEIAGCHWARIRDELHDKRLLSLYIGERVGISQIDRIPILKEEYGEMLTEYRKEKYDRCLRNAGIWFAILASLVAVIEATIAIIKVAE